MVDDVDDVGRVEVLKNRYYDCTIGDCGDVAYTPAGVVTADKSNLIATLNAHLLKHKVDLSDLLSKLVVREVFALEVVGESRHLTVVAEALLVNLY